jgi:thiosulfate reductase cytochrome b subunit
MVKIYLYTRFERFWHWVQGLLIILLLLTGFELHGTYTLMGFETAHNVHIFCAWTWLILFAFIIFWVLTTGEWRQYVPTMKKIVDVGLYYMVGIFKGAPHPVPKTTDAKHNPLQRLTYLGIVTALLPFQMITGFLYYYYNSWEAWGIGWSLGVMAFLHTLGAFLVLQFLIVHVYMTTTGHTPWAHIASMITGWEEVEEKAVQDWERKKQPAS